MCCKTPISLFADIILTKKVSSSKLGSKRLLPDEIKVEGKEFFEDLY